MLRPAATMRHALMNLLISYIFFFLSIQHVQCEEVLQDLVTIDVNSVKQFELVCPTELNDDIILW